MTRKSRAVAGSHSAFCVLRAGLWGLLLGFSGGALAQDNSSANPSLPPLPPVAGYPAPAWFSASRIHAHTRISPQAFYRSPSGAGLEDFLYRRGPAWETAFRAAGVHFRDLGVSVFTRHAKTADEPPPWSTQVPQPHDPITSDLVTPMVADAHGVGRRILLYYWDIGDRLTQERYPEWACRTSKGALAGHSVKGPYLDIASPYGAVVSQRLRELRALGADGVYLDFRHYPPKGCFQSMTEALFRTQHPEFAEMHSSRAAFWDAFQPFQAQMMARVLHGWTGPMRADPDFAPVVSVTSLPALPSREMSLDLARTGIPKTEFHMALRPGVNEFVFRRNPDLGLFAPPPEVRMGFGWRMLADISGSAPHVWTNGVPTYDQALLAVGGIITFGGIANIDIDERNIPTATDAKGVTPRAVLEDIYGLDATVGPLFAKAVPARFAAVHFSERLKNTLTPRARWTTVALPALRLFEALHTHMIPVSIVDDRLLEEGSIPASIVLSATPEAITPAAQENMARQGVRLIPVPPTQAFAGGGATALHEGLAEVAQAWAQAPGLKLQLAEGTQAYGTLWHDPQGRSVLSVVRPFGEVQTQTRSAPISSKQIWEPPKAYRDAIWVTFEGMSQGGRLCAIDPISGQNLRMEGNQLELPGPALWRLAVLQDCGAGEPPSE